MKRLRAATGPVRGVVSVPGSKSIANRALAAAALADGDSHLSNVPDGDDTVAMVHCLAGLGIGVEVGDDGVVFVDGSGGRLDPRASRLDARLAGTTSRFVTALTALADTPITIDGDPPLRRRPMTELHDVLRSLGAQVDDGGRGGRLPVTVTGPLRKGGTVRLRGDVSSQFVSAVMLIAPLLAGGVRIELTSPLVSQPYVRLTAAVMAAFGVTDVDISAERVDVRPGRYVGTGFAVEPDASSASYPLAVAAVRGGAISVNDLRPDSLQGDIAIIELLTAMGCAFTFDEHSITVARDEAETLHGIDVDMAATSDLVPTIAAVATTASTPTTIRGVGFIRSKESDRLGDLVGELAKTGADVRQTDDGLRVDPVPGGAAGLHGAVLHTHHDHRLAMAFAVLGAGVDGIAIDDPDVVTKSWPGFWTSYDALLGGA
ncbi:MAG: 3-phosphoshikimate 1-carboxyvinyltransferase [Ilumatobacteraceae bacterium]